VWKRAILSVVENGRKAEEVVMKTLVLALSLVLLLMTGSYAGPNEGVVLTAHGNVDGVETEGDPCTSILIPEDCHETIPEAAPDASGMEWFLVVVARNPDVAFNTIHFGVLDYDPSACVIDLYGPCHQELEPLEISAVDWPGPNSWTAVSWAPECLEGTVVPVYYLGIYAYGSAAIPLGDPDGRAVVVSCTTYEEDPFADFGALGCGGAEGYNPCEGPTPTRQTTWGQIKSIYR
jgi:hypothetical protein